MQRRVPVQQLRGSDATLLEVQVQPLVRRPMGQLAPENVLDLLALAESDEKPRSLTRQLEQFVERCSREIVDMPGTSFADMLAELAPIDAERVPASFRAWIAAEQDKPDRDPKLIADQVAAWEGTEPAPFPIGDRQAKVQRAAGKGKASASRTASRTRSASRGTGGSSSTSSSKSTSAPRLDVGVADDPEKNAVLEKILMERLSGATSTGLAETVLIAGCRHRAKAEGYASVTPKEVTSALKGLKTVGRVSYSAGRWASTRSW